MNTEKFYVGNDVHAYTTFLQTKFSSSGEVLREPLSESDWKIMMEDLQTKYAGAKHVVESHVFSNLESSYKKGIIYDPTLPQINVARILYWLWRFFTKKNNPDFWDYFGWTLSQIGATCMQGISHRLLFDFITFYEA